MQSLNIRANIKKIIKEDMNHRATMNEAPYGAFRFFFLGRVRVVDVDPPFLLHILE